MGQKTDGSLPNITGTTQGIVCYTDSFSGALYSSGNLGLANWVAGNAVRTKVCLDASRSSSVYTSGQTRVKSAGLYVMYCIKY